MFQTEVVEKSKHTFCVQWLFFFKLCHLWDNVEKYCRAEQATDDKVLESDEKYQLDATIMTYHHK